MFQSLQKYFPVFVITGILLNATGLFNDVLDPDGTLYASIAKHMAINNDWINLFGDNHDWLDKPHFPFWITALSYKFFGINAFAYKFPAFLFWLAGLRYTYLIAKELYNQQIAQVSAIIYLITLHTVLANFDVRAEPYLTTLTTGSIYYLLKDFNEKKWSFLLAAAFLAACAVMTKGIFALITVAGGFAVYWMVTKQWREFLNLRWWLLALLIIIFITPELYCLYVQFDMHPEKIVFNQTGVSGLRFFFWDSQFGRFFNTGPIKGSGDISFFLHTMLWAFLPWSVIFYLGIFRLTIKKNAVKDTRQWIIYSGAGITFLLFSFSKFQLPHYIIILFPQFSMIAADYLVNAFASQQQKTARRLFTVQSIFLILVSIAVCALTFYAGIPGLESISIASILVVFTAIIVFKKATLFNTIARSYAFAVVLYPFLNFFFYPYIMQYQSGMQAAKWLKENNINTKLALYKDFSHAFEFYATGEPAWIFTPQELNTFIGQNNQIVLYTQTKELDSLQQQGFKINKLKDFEYFRISMLTPKFLNPATRNDAITKVSLAAVSR